MRKSTRQSRYLRDLLLTAAAAIALIAAFNLLVDPYSYFGTRDIRGLNVRKPRPDEQIAVVKYEAAARLGADVLVLGNSRADVGFDPEHPVFAGHLAYNLGVPGAGICTAWWNLQALAARQPVHRAIAGIEFLDFLTAAPPSDCGPTPSYFQHARLADRGRALFTIGGLMMSVRAVRLQSDPYPDEVTARGFSPMRNYDRQATEDGYYVMFEQRAQEYARNFARLPHSLRAPGAASSLELETLRAMVRHAVANRERLDLVIYPYHLELLLLIRASDLWPLFEDFKRSVVAIVDEETRVSGRDLVRVWDFTGVSPNQQEPIPPPGNHVAVTRWYWEAGHFKKPLGDLVLERMAGAGADSDAADCRVFGVRLEASTLEQCLVQQRESLQGAGAAAPELASHVEQLARDARRPDGLTVKP